MPVTEPLSPGAATKRLAGAHRNPFVPGSSIVPPTVNPDAIPRLAAFFRQPFIERAIAGRHTRELRTAVLRLGITSRAFLNRPLQAVLADFYCLLKRHYRCEYVFKNVIASSLYLQRHSPETGFLAAEFRCGESRVDVAIFNGTSTAYEIKTELDSFSKLPLQIADYRKVFDRVYVVVPDGCGTPITGRVDEGVGIIVVDRHFRPRTVRQAVSNASGVSPGAIFDVLRRNEYLSVLGEACGFVPDCANSELRARARSLFAKFSPEQAHHALLQCMRSRRTDATLVLSRQLPAPLRYLGLTLRQQSNFIANAREVLRTCAV